MDNVMLSLPVTIIVIYVIGFVGYTSFRYLRIPAPALTGAIVALGIPASFGLPFAPVPGLVKVTFQTVIGILVGSRFGRERVPELRALLIPGTLVTTWMVGTGLGLGLILYELTSLDLGTALFSAVPGGIAEMSTFALAYHLDVPTVVVLQFVRLVGIYMIVPALVRKFAPVKGKEPVTREIAATLEKTAAAGQTISLPNTLLTLLLGGGGGFLAWWVGVPAGGLIGAMLVVALLRLTGLGLQPLPKKLVVFAQIGLGGILGLTFTPVVARALGGIVIPVLLVSFFMVLSGTLLGFLVHRLFGWDLTTSLLACAAAGASQMSSIALDMQADALKVGLIQAMRLPAIVLILPPIISLLIR